MTIETVLGELRTRIEPLERLVQLFANSLEQPKLYHFDSDRGFRFEVPDIRHFCLLKAIRVVSALNASLELVRGGYTQEFAVLLRTLVECTTHIEYVLDPNESEQHRGEVKKYVEAFFADSRRDPAVEIRKAQVRQGAVHTLLGKTLDTITGQYGHGQDRRPAAELMSSVYRVYSNYVHAKYPEIMDLYGGMPGCFHLRGMSGTPKDLENIEVFRTFITTVANTFVLMVRALKLHVLVETDPVVAAWYRAVVPIL
jgi:hypothetical protein